MSEVSSEQLAELVSASESADYGATGFHHTHTSSIELMPKVAELFLQAGYILEMITCQDIREEHEVMRLCYTFNRLEAVDRHLFHADLNPDTQEAPTLCGIYGGANWFEREVYDMYGVRFADHPELERLLLPEDADFFALRKDFGRMEDAPEASE
jgi:NADH-quinone oxidoreductase subunit C